MSSGPSAKSIDGIDSWIVLTGLVCIIAVAWSFLLAGLGMETVGHVHGAHGDGEAVSGWTLGRTVLTFIMWAVMMAAMMLPGAVPVALQAARSAKRQQTRPAALAAFGFMAGYLLVWMGFSLVATLLQWTFDAARMLSAQAAVRSTAVAAVLTFAAGFYQWSSLKRACLVRCRRAAGCMTESRTYGAWPAVRRGLRYGGACLGCCSLMMILPFIVGVMNVFFMLLLTLWAAAEKTFFWNDGMTRLSAVALLCWGLALLAGIGN